ncbi:hypothetical protein CW304_13550 [Bacillus sp. UFRGS-B20]|nr:hypothetical protein CW304_13550 [Bacillus sp. UFRGS-B20]
MKRLKLVTDESIHVRFTAPPMCYAYDGLLYGQSKFSVGSLFSILSYQDLIIYEMLDWKHKAFVFDHPTTKRNSKKCQISWGKNTQRKINAYVDIDGAMVVNPVMKIENQRLLTANFVKKIVKP